MASQYDRPLYFAAVVSFFFLLFFPRLRSAAAEGMSTILPEMMWISANVECRSEMYCTRLAEIQDAKVRENSPSAHHRTHLSGYTFVTKAYTRILTTFEIFGAAGIALCTLLFTFVI